MLSIYTLPELINEVSLIIENESRLNELVTVFDIDQPRNDTFCLLINDKGIHWPLNWQDNRPPYLIPNVELNQSNLLASVYFRLGNYERAWDLLDEGHVLLRHFSVFDLLSQGYLISDDVITFVQDPTQYLENGTYFASNNESILRHYGNFDDYQSYELITSLYEKAVKSAPNPELATFTTKHWAIFLLDNGQLSKAESLLRDAESNTLSDDSAHGIKSVLVDVLLTKLVVPYDEFLLGEVKSLLWETLEYERAQGHRVNEGLRLLDAAHISLIGKSYSEALGYLNKAAGIFEEEDIPEFLGESMRKKGSLLYTWAQDGNPQFFKSALDSYQAALKIFTKEAAPSVFADIHHNLGIIYSEIPTEEKKKGLMASIALTSFQQALDFYTKDAYPYEYATICTHYGNALCKFPPAINSDNFEKALFYYADALAIRTEKYPVERALTLLNYIEASWNVKDDKDFNQARYEDMKSKAEEVLRLVDDPEIQAAAHTHLENLEKLKSLSTQS